MGRLRTVYPNIMKLEYDNQRTRQLGQLADMEADVQQKSPIRYFEEFYEKQNHQSMQQEQRQLVTELIEKIWG